MLSTLCKVFSRHILKYFLSFPRKQDSTMEIIYMKYQVLFSVKNKKNSTNLLSAELAKRVTEEWPHLQTLLPFFIGKQTLQTGIYLWSSNPFRNWSTLNPFMPSGLFYLNSLDMFISYYTTPVVSFSQLGWFLHILEHMFLSFLWNW